MNSRLKSESMMPKRLQQARQLRGITSTELAELVGVSRQMINRYESGVSVPSPDVLLSLAQQLNVPVGFFSKPIIDTGSAGTVFYRKAAATTLRVQKMVDERKSFIEDIVRYIEDYVDLPLLDLPDFGHIERPEDGWNMDTIEQLASETRRAWGLGNGPISNMVTLLEQHGVIIGRIPEIHQHVDACSWITPLHPFVLLESSKTAVHERFDLAHELGHLVLHTGLDKDVIKRDHQKIEEEAHRFASAFLLPSETFAMEVVLPSLSQLQVLKLRWNVSIQAMIRRLYDLELIDQINYQRLYKQISLKRWNRQELLDDVIDKEQPSLLRESIELLFDHGVKSPQVFLSELILPHEEIESLCVIPKGALNPRWSGVKIKRVK